MKLRHEYIWQKNEMKNIQRTNLRDSYLPIFCRELQVLHAKHLTNRCGSSKAFKMYFKASIQCLVLLCAGVLEANALVAELATDAKSVPGQYLVTLASNDDRVTQAFHSKLMTSQFFTLKGAVHSQLDTVYLLNINASVSEANVKEHLLKEFGESVAYVTKNYVTSAFDDEQCVDDTSPCLSQNSLFERWGLSRISQRDSLQDDTTSHRYSWSDSNAGANVTVYVLDSGVMLEHQEFEHIDASWGYTGSSIAENEPDTDLNGHGTHVAGIVAGHLSGVAKRANIVAVKVLNENGTGTLFDFLEGLLFVIDCTTNLTENGDVSLKTVVNLSLGFPFNFSIINQVLAYGHQRLGIIYVAAAGNNDGDACLTSPASSRDVITVGAIDDKDQMTFYSNYGICVDILAPGDEIKSAGIGSTSVFVYMSGTSMAAPFVAGVVARLLSNRQAPLNDTHCVYEHLYETAIHDAVSGVKGATPNRLLYGGCNTCFNDRDCDDIGHEWTRPTYQTTTGQATTVRGSFYIMTVICAIITRMFV